MKNFILLKRVTSLLFVILLFSCASRKDLVYYQNIDKKSPQQKTNSYEVKLQPDDLLLIIVSAEDPEIAAPFNLRSISIEDAKSGLYT
ncbi:MAG: polysaccharide export protein, partial [Flavobacterium sp.]